MRPAAGLPTNDKRRMLLKRPIGLVLIVVWCFLRGIAGTWGSLQLLAYLLCGIGRVSDVVFVFVVEGAVWLLLGFGLWRVSKAARILTVVWCSGIVLWTSYGFFAFALPRWQELRLGGVYFATFAIHGGIIIYLLRPTVARFFESRSEEPKTSQLTTAD